jgi:Fic-DOC domain mobile mystery protein B
MPLDDVIPGATPLSPEDLEGLLLEHVSTRDQLNEVENQNIYDAQEWLEPTRISNVVSIDFLRDLHRRMFCDVWSWAGNFRQRQTNIGVEAHRIQTELYKLCGDVVYQLEQTPYDLLELIANYHHRLVWIHPFPNGNGRWSRLACDALLTKRLNLPALDWSSEDLTRITEERTTYIATLNAADKHDIGLLKDYLAARNPELTRKPGRNPDDRDTNLSI